MTVNSKLANELGNLLYRTLSFAYKHCDRAVPTPQQPLLEADEALLAAAAGLLPQLRGVVGELTLHRYSQTVSQVVQLGNQYIDVQAPWALRKTDPERMATVLWVLLEALRHVGVASQPVVPGLASQMLDQLGVDHAERSFECVAPGHRHALTAGAPLPTPRIVIPRYEPPEEPEPLEPPRPPEARPLSCRPRSWRWRWARRARRCDGSRTRGSATRTRRWRRRWPSCCGSRRSCPSPPRDADFA